MTPQDVTRWHQQLKLTDKQALGEALQAQDVNAEYLLSNRTYAWHYAIGRATRARRIGEIGVRFGYALFCLAQGSVSDLPPPLPRLELWGWDREEYVDDSLAIATRNLERFDAQVELRKLDTQELFDLGCPPLELIHVDGDHSTAGCWHDMALAWAALAPGGTMLVDDYDFMPGVAQATAAFAKMRRMDYFVLPTFRGTAVLLKED